jgi:hypothetical protein
MGGPMEIHAAFLELQVLENLRALPRGLIFCLFPSSNPIEKPKNIRALNDSSPYSFVA